MKKIFLTIIYSYFSVLAIAQNTVNQDFTNNYTPLFSTGKIPNEILATSTSKFKKDAEKAKKEAKSKKERKSRQTFALETNFVLDNLLQSGAIVFNDKITLYLEKVLAKVNEKSKTEVKIYTLRSNAVNAFASARGEIFVTLGLLAQLEDEAQLAFILSHELTHIKEKHSLELFLDTEGIGAKSTDKQLLKKSSFDDKVLRKCAYSKELEKKADDGGMEIIKKSAYDLTDLDGVFDVLKYAYLPFDDIKFNTTMFESDNYKLPASVLLDKVNPISTEDKDDDSKSTHPSIKSRRAEMIAKLKNFSKKDQKAYLVSENLFNEMREIARFELPLLYLRDEAYPEAFYSSYLLLQKYPNNLFAKKCMAKALYFHTKYLNENSNEEVVEVTDNTDKKEKPEGEIHAVHYFFEKMPNKEMTIFAARSICNLYEKNPNDSELKALAEDILYEAATHKLTLSNFDVKKEKATTEAKTTETKKDKDKNKSEKMKKVQKNETSSSKSDYWVSAFDEIKESKNFKDAFEKWQKIAKERDERKAYAESKEGKREWSKYTEKSKKKGLRMGIDKIVVINPFYLKLDANQKNSLEYVKTEEGQVHFSELIKQIADKTGMNIEVLDVANLSDKEIEKFNDIRTLNEYFSEQNNRSDLSLTPGIEQAKLDVIAKKYGTKYFLWTGVVSLKEDDTQALYKLATCIIMPYYLPFAIYDLAVPDYDMLQYAILFDVTTGKRQTVKYDYFDHKDSDAVVKAHLYDTFNQITKK